VRDDIVKQQACQGQALLACSANIFFIVQITYGNFSSSGQIFSQSTRGAAHAQHQQHGNRRLHPTDAWEQHNSIVKFLQT